MLKCDHLIDTGKKRACGKTLKILYHCEIRDLKIGLPNNICLKCDQSTVNPTPIITRKASSANKKSNTKTKNFVLPNTDNVCLKCDQSTVNPTPIITRKASSATKKSNTLTNNFVSTHTNNYNYEQCTIFKMPKKYKHALTTNQALGHYYSYNEGRNPYHDEFSKLILEVKKSKENAIAYFTERLSTIISENSEYVICVIPSHEKGIKPSGIRTIGENLCKPHVIDGTNCIIRAKTLESKHSGGIRNFEQELNSLTIENKDIISGKQVLLLDDVATTGISLKAGRQLLLKNGAKFVAAFALGHTASIQ